MLLLSATHADAQKIKWRGYLKPNLPAGWELKGKTLTRVAAAGDIITEQTYENFELTLEWKISKGGNSGIFFHVVEDPKFDAVYLTGPEMQVLDNKGHSDGRLPLTSAGSDFAVHAPSKDVTKPVGQWNKVKLVVKGSHVEHWLNGTKLLEYELWSDDWKQRVAASKFKTLAPQFGMAKTGHIALQDHGDWVSFRNIKIKRLE